MPTARIRSALSRIPLGRALIALGLVLVGINVGSAIWDIRSAYDRTERRALRYYANMTRLLAEQTAASMEAVDLILRDAVRTGRAGEVADVQTRVGEELLRVPQIGAMMVLDAQGEVLARSSQTPAFDPDLAERPFFAAHRDGAPDLRT
jgi:hypothetical protein